MRLLVLFLIFILTCSIVTADLIRLSGEVVDSSGLVDGDIRFTIYDNASGGTLVYDSGSDFNGSIVNGSYNVLLGSNTSLDLIYGRVYFLDISINEDDLDFDGDERQEFQSSVGDIIESHENSSAEGTGALAYGNNATASGNYSVALGGFTSASSAQAIAIGRESITQSPYGISIGYRANNTGGTNAIAIGAQSEADLGVAIGYQSFSDGYGVAVGENSYADASSVSIGRNSYAVNPSSIALGNNAATNGELSIAFTNTNVSAHYTAAFNLDPTVSDLTVTDNGTFVVYASKINFTNSSVDTELCLNNNCITSWPTPGNVSFAEGSYANGATLAIGTSSSSVDNDSIAIGTNSLSSDPNDIAIGTDAWAFGITGGNATAIGTQADAKNINAIAIGSSSHASGWSSIAMGEFTNSSSLRSIAIGYYSNATQSRAISIGDSVLVNSTDSVGIGADLMVLDQSSVAIGKDINTTGGSNILVGSQLNNSLVYSILIGNTINVSSRYSIAIGRENTIDSDAHSSIAIGDQAQVIGDSDDSIAIGTSTSATSVNAIAIGNLARATKSDALAIGQDTLADGPGAISFPRTNVTGTWSVGYNLDSVTSQVDVFQNSSFVIYGGNVGVNTTTPIQLLDVAGVMRLSPTDTPGTCDGSTKGSMYMDDSLSVPCFCNSTAWVRFEDSSVTC